MPKVTDDYHLPLMAFLFGGYYLQQLNQDLDKYFSNFKSKQKYSQTNLIHLCITAGNKPQEVSKWHAELIRHQKA